jgi:pimeloyl-ACP methyl ester carboxylesterase
VSALLKKNIPKIIGFYLNVLVWFRPKTVAQKAFSIFSKVRKGRVLPHQKEFLDNAKLEEVEIENHIIQTYTWKGTRETVLLVHGWESNSWRWHKLIEKLKQANYNIIAFDGPGHGYSSGTNLHVPLYAEALEKMLLKYSPTIVIGHSVGGMTVLYNEFKNPNSKTEKIITIGLPSEFDEILTHYQNLLSLNSKVMSVLKKYVKERFSFTPKEFSSARFVVNNTKKGLLFHDKLDTITPYHASVSVNEHWKGSQLISTEGFGHSMHQDELNNQIIDFLAQ